MKSAFREFRYEIIATKRRVINGHTDVVSNYVLLHLELQEVEQLRLEDGRRT